MVRKARSLAALAAVASYLINALGQLTSAMRPARPVWPYYLVLGNEPLAHGLRLIGAVSVLAAVAVLSTTSAEFSGNDLECRYQESKHSGQTAGLIAA